MVRLRCGGDADRNARDNNIQNGERRLKANQKLTYAIMAVLSAHAGSAIAAEDAKNTGEIADVVVTAGVQALRPGQKVRLLELPAGAQK